MGNQIQLSVQNCKCNVTKNNWRIPLLTSVLYKNRPSVCINSSRLSNALCVLSRARHVVRTIIRIAVLIEFQKRSVRMHFSRYGRVSCCTVRARHICTVDLFKTCLQVCAHFCVQ